MQALYARPRVPGCQPSLGSLRGRGRECRDTRQGGIHVSDKRGWDEVIACCYLYPFDRRRAPLGDHATCSMFRCDHRVNSLA